MNPFLEACGATGLLQLSIECQGATPAERVTFDLPCVLIGRDPGADLHFPHQDVSERHVYLQMVAGHLCYMDLGSRMGTFLGGKSLRSGWLPRQKTIRIGPYRVRLLGGDVGEWASADRPTGGGNGFAPPPFADAAPPRLTLELSHRGIRPALCPIHGDLTLVGSSTDCDVRVLDPSVSNYHCSLLHTPAGIWVVDLLGRGGVLVNGAPVRSALVRDGDELRIGHSLIRLRSEPAREPADCPISVPAGSLPARAALPEPSVALPAVPAAVTVDRTELVEAILAPLSDRFNVMQEQMFEQLHQAGMVMFERYSALHEEQLGLLRRELDQLRRLTRELDTLRSDLAARIEDQPRWFNGTAPASALAPPRLGMATTAPPRPSLPCGPLVLAEAEVFTGNGNGNGNGNGTTMYHPDSFPSVDLSSIHLGPSVEPAAVAPAEAARVTVEVKAPIALSESWEGHGGPERRQDVDIHAWLCQRISMIQTEQQSRWEKILSMIPGQLLGRPTV